MGQSDSEPEERKLLLQPGKLIEFKGTSLSSVTLEPPLPPVHMEQPSPHTRGSLVACLL